MANAIKPSCIIDDCERPQRYAGTGYCGPHHNRFVEFGDPLATPIGIRNPRKGKCAADGCDRPDVARGLCSSHYSWHKRNGLLEGFEKYPEICIVEGCDRKSSYVGMCGTHYNRKIQKLDLEKPIRRKRTNAEVLFRDENGNKNCYGCDQWLPESSFQQWPVGDSRFRMSDGFYPRCRACASHLTRATRYGLGEDRLRGLYEAQNGLCAICAVGLNSEYHVDHDHACCPYTKAAKAACGDCVRGLLCGKCNLLLGQADDSVEKLLSAVRYLKEWEESCPDLKPLSGIAS